MYTAFSLIPTKPQKEAFFFLFYSRENQGSVAYPSFPKTISLVCVTPKPSSFQLTKLQCRKGPHPLPGW